MIALRSNVSVLAKAAGRLRCVDNNSIHHIYIYLYLYENIYLHVQYSGCMYNTCLFYDISICVLLLAAVVLLLLAISTTDCGSSLLLRVDR